MKREESDWEETNPRDVKKIPKSVKPCSGRLLKTVQSIFEKTNVIGIVGINKARWLSHVNHFIEIAMKKGVVYVKLTKRPTLGNG